MRSTNQSLTDGELIYAKGQFKSIRNKIKLPWIICAVFTCLGLLGMLVVDGQIFLFGTWFLVFGILGAFFFKRNGYQTTFNILPTGMMYQGVLNMRFVGSPENGQNVLFLDDHRLETPGKLENHCSDLVEKYKNQMVNVTLAVLEEKKGIELHANHYLPLKIEYELCIESAIKNHGPEFLKKVTRESYSTILMPLLLFISIPLVVIFVLDSFDFLDLIPLTILMFLALLVAFILQEKSVPIEEIELQEKLKCTCL